jgi:hypothetical protein
LAGELKVSKARVSQMVGAGLPVRPDGKIDLNRALRWVEEHIDRGGAGWPTRKAAAPASPAISAPAAPAQSMSASVDPGRALLIARIRKLMADTRRAEREEKRAAGELIDVATVAAYTTDLSRLVRDHALAQADRLAGVLAAASDPAEAYRIIRKDNAALLTKLSKALASGPQ